MCVCVFIMMYTVYLFWYPSKTYAGVKLGSCQVALLSAIYIYVYIRSSSHMFFWTSPANVEPKTPAKVCRQRGHSHWTIPGALATGAKELVLPHHWCLTLHLLVKFTKNLTSNWQTQQRNFCWWDYVWWDEMGYEWQWYGNWMELIQAKNGIIMGHEWQLLEMSGI